MKRFIRDYGSGSGSVRHPVSNGASAFQRVIDEFILRHNLKKVYAYLNDLTVTGSTLEEHNQNLQKLLAAAEQDGLTFNEKKIKNTTRENTATRA